MRSYLHFSQLSAWLSSSRGERPKNVLFRITIPGEAFGSKFSKQPEEHIFPPAGTSTRVLMPPCEQLHIGLITDAGRCTSVRVSVRNLPRVNEIPSVVCGHHPASPGSNAHGSAGASSGEESEEGKLGMAGALSWRETSGYACSITFCLCAFGKPCVIAGPTVICAKP